MLLLLLSWIYLLFISLGWGIFVQKFLPQKPNIFYTLLLGLFGNLIVLHFYAIFFPINAIYYGISSGIALLGIFSNRIYLKEKLKIYLEDWKNWKKSIQILSILLTVLILIQSATKPYLIDNETYYIQTIKWLNEYGLVKGLANLHIFLGQQSGWHILQAGFNFGFISDSLNGINGFLLVVCTFFSLNHLNRFFTSKITMDLFLGLIPILNLLFFQFINIPSPDFPIFILSPIIFYLFYKNCVDYQGDFRLLLILSVFLILAKISVAPLLILPLVLLIKHRLWKNELSFFLSIGLISLIAFCLKNHMISGYLFYPTDFLGNLISVDWQLPEIVQKEFTPTKAAALTHLSLEETAQLNTWQYLKEWLVEPGLRAIFNKLIIVLLLIFPFYIYKNKTLFWLYIYALIQFFLLFFISPQYRFFFPLIIGMSLYMFAKLFLNRPIYVIGFVTIFALLPILTLFVPLNIEKIKNQKNSADQTFAFQLENLIIPPKNSGKDFEFELKQEGNLQYHSPKTTEEFYWFTGDGELPTADFKMIKSFKHHLKIRPQMRTNDVKDGFYAEKLDE